MTSTEINIYLNDKNFPAEEFEELPEMFNGTKLERVVKGHFPYVIESCERSIFDQAGLLIGFVPLRLSGSLSSISA